MLVIIVKPCVANNGNIHTAHLQEKMDDSEEYKGTAQLLASEASAGAKGGGGDCNDVNTIANIGMREG